MAFSASYSWQAATDPCTLDSVDLMWLRTLEMRKSDKAQGKMNQSKYKKHPSGQLNTDEVSNMSSIMDRRCRSCFFWIESAEDYLEIKESRGGYVKVYFFEVEMFIYVYRAWSNGGLWRQHCAFVHLFCWAISEVQNVALQLVHHCCELSVLERSTETMQKTLKLFFCVVFFTNLWLFKMSGQQNE